MIGKVKLLQYLAYALFDLEASQSFRSTTLVQLCDLMMKPLPQRVLMTISNGNVIGSTRVVKDCPLVVPGLVLKENLIVFRLMEFDVILGMDWLFRHNSKIDC